MKVTAINGFEASCEAKGVQRDVSLFMMQQDEVGIGDFVLVHVGYAIQKVSPQEARSAWELFDEVLGTASIPLTESEHV
jgi:hydrogenase expression/formation protein HypC